MRKTFSPYGVIQEIRVFKIKAMHSSDFPQKNLLHKPFVLYMAMLLQNNLLNVLGVKNPMILTRAVSKQLAMSSSNHSPHLLHMANSMATWDIGVILTKIWPRAVTFKVV